MKIAICDDDEKDRIHIKHYIQTHNLQHDIIEFNLTLPLLQRINENEHFDVLFLDIEMPDPNGWNVAAQLKKRNPNIYIAMVTINDNYVFDCFDRVNWFAPKPISEAKVHKILDNAYEKLYPIIFEFTIDKTPLILTAPEIIYIEVKRNHIYIHTRDQIHKIRNSMCNITKQFEMPYFVSPHQSFIVNLEHFNTLVDNQILLKNGAYIPLSRSRSKLFYNALREHVRRRKSYV